MYVCMHVCMYVWPTHISSKPVKSENTPVSRRRIALSFSSKMPVHACALHEGLRDSVPPYERMKEQLELAHVVTYMYVCMHVCMYVHVDWQEWKCSWSSHMLSPTCMYVYVCMYSHVYVYVYVCVCICICVCIYVYVYVHVHVYV
jgi:hypothetical protein